MSRFPNTTAAFEAGRKQGAQEERERIAKQGKTDEAGDPDRLTLEDIRAGKYGVDDLIGRKEEVDALLAGGQG